MQSRKVTLSVPAPKVDFEKVAKEIAKTSTDYLEKIINYLYSVAFPVVRNLAGRVRRRRTGDNQLQPINKYSETKRRKLNPQVLKITKILLIIVATVAAVTLLSRLVRGIGGTSSSNQASVAGAKATQDISRGFAFPIRNGDGEEVSTIVYHIEKAELLDEIIVKGQRATAIKGRIFLIITLKITNEYSQAIEIDTRDYLRLSVNENEEELLAPDIHNDPVEVQAISTKFSRLGFPINDSDKNLVLRVGEISEDKEKIVLDLN